tara:strand:+ start:637 stop:774 length:138 start_codon:yes stop_codon:yes gene_type:complete
MDAANLRIKAGLVCIPDADPFDSKNYVNVTELYDEDENETTKLSN